MNLMWILALIFYTQHVIGQTVTSNKEVNPENGRRKIRLKRKRLDQGSALDQTQKEIQLEPLNITKATVDPRSPRGFLDDYYSQFNNRVHAAVKVKNNGHNRQEKETYLKLNKENNENRATSSISLKNLEKYIENADNPNKSPNNFHQRKGEAALIGARSINVDDYLLEHRGLPDEKPVNVDVANDKDDNDIFTNAKENDANSIALHDEINNRIAMYLASKQLQGMRDAENNKMGYKQKLTLPKLKPKSDAYMYSSALSPVPSASDSLEQHPNLALGKIDKYSSASSQKSIYNLFDGHSDSISDSYTVPEKEMPSYSFAESISKNPMGRFFGLTGTTSQNIQLGLTFTVPFLSIPMNSVNSIIGGGDGSGLSDVFNFDTSNLAVVAALAVGAIFILPQLIYWTTGVNLSAFNWARNEDGAFGITTLANIVDEALSQYDVDIKSCIARTMCEQIQTKSSKSVNSIEDETDTLFTKGILHNFARNDYVQKFIGESRIDEALKVASSPYKTCSKYYNNISCPWDPSALTKIASRLIADSDIDLAGLAAQMVQKLASAAISNN